MLECVVNISEGADRALVGAIGAAAGHDLLDVHADPDHNRAVLTLVGEEAPRRVARVAVDRLDLRRHQGAHPRFGVVDVVPFVPLAGSTMADAETARDRFATWIADELGVPAFTYGRHRSLPELRRRAFRDLVPDTGPGSPHPTAGAVAVGARGVLVAWNPWLAGPDGARAREVAGRGGRATVGGVWPDWPNAPARVPGRSVSSWSPPSNEKSPPASPAAARTSLRRRSRRSSARIRRCSRWP